MPIKVTVEDTDTGTTETAVVDDYLIVTADPCHLAHRAAYRNGTHVITIKNATRPPAQTSTTFASPQ